ncbi:hypothetical protein ACHAXT_007176 [Thalassiosira profunda]
MVKLKRLLGLKKGKVKADADLYEPPSIDGGGPSRPPSTGPLRPQHAAILDGENSHGDPAASYRRIRAAYADTIDPALSNEDGMGGGGGRLRSRSGRMRGSAGTKHKGSLVPAFERQGASAAISPDGTIGPTARQDRSDAYDNIVWGGGLSPSERTAGGGRRDGASWRPIPESPRRDNSDIERSGGSGAIDNGESAFAQPLPLHHQPSSRTESVLDEVLSQEATPNLQPSGKKSRPRPIYSATKKGSTPHSPRSPENTELILQPDAIYEEHYGDAYVDGLIKYLYPEGYQSMRPRSGPWKLSLFVFVLFMWLSVFIVGHCYDRGRREYNFYYDNVDDAYIQEMDDDAVVMETRWCGSKPLYFTWLVSVWITVLAMSYCSIIGYVKVRDVAVANGRSQLPTTASEHGRSDYYVSVENAAAGGTGEAGGDLGEGGSQAPSDGASSAYSSYQVGRGGRGTPPSIWLQSDGTPQFWGGHIYRPTQAAVTMTNRP